MEIRFGRNAFLKATMLSLPLGRCSRIVQKHLIHSMDSAFVPKRFGYSWDHLLLQLLTTNFLYWRHLLTFWLFTITCCAHLCYYSFGCVLLFPFWFRPTNRPRRSWKRRPLHKAASRELVFSCYPCATGPFRALDTLLQLMSPFELDNAVHRTLRLFRTSSHHLKRTFVWFPGIPKHQSCPTYSNTKYWKRSFYKC